MPYFMRLSCRDFGMHEGVVQPYPASHGCIRLPGDAAKKLFAEIPVGTLVTIN
jgi:lipoprotein-anchoring transpeptidase ErfK/SrfK